MQMWPFFGWIDPQVLKMISYPIMHSRVDRYVIVERYIIYHMLYMKRLMLKIVLFSGYNSISEQLTISSCIIPVYHCVNSLYWRQTRIRSQQRRMIREVLPKVGLEITQILAEKSGPITILS